MMQERRVTRTLWDVWRYEHRRRELWRNAGLLRMVRERNGSACQRMNDLRSIGVSTMMFEDARHWCP
jgi:hypothetical protein